MEIRDLSFETQVLLSLAWLKLAAKMERDLPSTSMFGPFPASFVVSLDHARLLLVARRTVGVCN